MRDTRLLADLVEFARLEVESSDIEPWAATIAAMTRRDVVGVYALDREQALWMLTLYNTTDNLLSALTIAACAPSPADWRKDSPGVREVTERVPLSGERRNLFGGRILRRMDSYAGHVGDRPQSEWFAEAVMSSRHPFDNFRAMMLRLHRVWGVGRLAAFEWAEFLAKVDGLPLETNDGQLWESSGPRESLERIYLFPPRDAHQLRDWAYNVKSHLAAQGVPLSWWDFETVICDFNVMRKGRYYPGKHLAMISEEIAGLPDHWRPAWETAYRSTVPEPWRDLRPGVDKALARHYALTGKIRTPLEVVS